MRVPEYKFPVQSYSGFNSVARGVPQSLTYTAAQPQERPVEVAEYDPFAELMAKPRSTTPANDLETAAVGCRVIRYCRLCGRTNCSASDAWWITRLVPDRLAADVGPYGELSPATMQALDSFYGRPDF